jgi:hypothetical protein
MATRLLVRAYLRAKPFEFLAQGAKLFLHPGDLVVQLFKLCLRRGAGSRR